MPRATTVPPSENETPADVPAVAPQDVPEVPETPSEAPTVAEPTHPADTPTVNTDVPNEPESPVETPDGEPEKPTPTLGGFTDTTAGNTAPTGEFRPVESTNQSEETRTANLGTEQGPPLRPVGTLISQKTLEELEDEIDNGVFHDITSFVKTHWEARDANIQLMARVLRMETHEIYTILKEELGVQLPQGV